MISQKTSFKLIPITLHRIKPSINWLHHVAHHPEILPHIIIIIIIQLYIYIFATYIFYLYLVFRYLSILIHYICSINLLDGIHCLKCFSHVSGVESTPVFRWGFVVRTTVFIYLFYSSLAMTGIRTCERFHSSVVWITSPER